MRLLTIIEFIGRFHPVLVHLPIGVLMTSLLLQWCYARKVKGISIEVIKLVLLVGMFAAFLACITGWLLSFSDDYDEGLIGWHMWMGIAVAFCSLLVYMKAARNELDITYKLLSAGMLVLIAVTGHLGGSLTHGAGYLTDALKMKADSAVLATKPILNIQEAAVYADVIDPMLRSKCYGCHGPDKQKGKFRMDNPQWLMKGGKDGPVIVPSDVQKSELIKRLLLPESDEHHMAPKEKPQLKEKQIALLHWWVGAGADFTKKVKDLPQPEKIRPYLLSLQSDHMVVEKKALPDVPSEPVEPADASAIQALRDRGVTVLPVSQYSNYLQVNYITATSVRNKDLEALPKLKKQLVWLKLGNTSITDSALLSVAQCKAVTVLQLNDTNITDSGIVYLRSLGNLASLNLVGTKVTAGGVMSLRHLIKLRSLFLYQTDVKKSEWAKLQAAFKTVSLDSGGYIVPVLATDTQVLKPPLPKKQ